MDLNAVPQRQLPITKTSTTESSGLLHHSVEKTKRIPFWSSNALCLNSAQRLLSQVNVPNWRAGRNAPLQTGPGHRATPRLHCTCQKSPVSLSPVWSK